MPKMMWWMGLKKHLSFQDRISNNNLWRGMFGVGLWHDIIVAKYLKNKPMDVWLCEMK